MDNKVNKEDIFVVLVRRFERYSNDGSYLIEDIVPKNEKYRKVILINGKYIDIYNKTEIERVEYGDNSVSTEVKLNTNYVGGIFTKLEEKGITITDEDVEVAQNTLDYYNNLEEQKRIGKIVDFRPRTR